MADKQLYIFSIPKNMVFKDGIQRPFSVALKTEEFPAYLKANLEYEEDILPIPRTMCYNNICCNPVHQAAKGKNHILCIFCLFEVCCS